MEKKTREVLEKIKNNKIKMRPKLYFWLGAMLMGTGLIILLLTGAFLVNLSAFHLFIYRGLSFPILLLTTLCLIGGYLILHQYDLSYKRDFWWIIAAIVAIVVIAGYGLSKTRINEHARTIRHLRIFYEPKHYILPPHLPSNRLRPISPPTARL